MPRRPKGPDPDVRRLGDEAERNAAEFLRSIGYTIITRNYHSRRGEIDLVALDQNTLVFVEVKARRSTVYRPEEAVDDVKVRRVVAAAEDYLADIGERERTIRFDLIAIDPEGLRHHIDAFRP